jgi:hypothetical protein
MHDPQQPLPEPPAYQNPKYFAFSPATRNAIGAGGAKSVRSKKSKRTARTAGSNRTAPPNLADGLPTFKKEFEKFHSENGVRTVIGSIGPAHNGMYTQFYLVLCY